MTKTITCQNCHAEMEAGKKTHSRVMEWTEYTCPNCGAVWSDGKPLPGHEPAYPVLAEAEAVVPAKKKRGKKVATAAAIIEEVEVEESNGC